MDISDFSGGTRVYQEISEEFIGVPMTYQVLIKAFQVSEGSKGALTVLVGVSGDNIVYQEISRAL